MTKEQKKQKGPRIKPSLKQTIVSEAIRYPTKPRAALAAELQDLIERMGEISPTDETLMRMISEARNKEESPLDKPWHMATLKDYPLPTEAIPSILAVLESQEMFTRQREVTIRQALWISRIHTVVKPKDDLMKIAWYYAFNERISEVSHTDFNTYEYDRRLSNPKKLLEYFENPNLKADFAVYKKAFEQTTGVEYAGVSFPVDHMFFDEEKVFAPINIKDKPIYLKLPFTDSKALLNGLKKENNIKSINKLDNGITLVVLKKSVSLAFENKEFNEYLHNLIKEGVK